MYLHRLIFGNFLACCLFVSSCGGGGGGGIIGIDGSGSRVSSVSVTGPINGFGSVIVGGVHYNTDNARIYIRGELAEEEALDVGDFVVVVGYVNGKGEGVASEVHYQPMVTGEIEWVDQAQNTFSVLGQTILLLNDTTFSEDIIPRNIEGLKVGQTVTVSGISDDNQNIRTTRVERSKTKTLDLVGVIGNFSANSNIYTVNGIKVDLSDLSSTKPHNIGDWIAVSGEKLSDGIFHAYHLNETMDYRQLKSVKTIKLNGFVRELKDNGHFFIDRVPVVVNENTQFIGGEASTLAKNSSVEVEGSLDAFHILIAEKVSFKPTPDTQVFGHITNIDPAKIGEFYLGIIEVQGNTFKIDFLTRLVGDRERRISFYDLRIGDNVIISGFYKNDKYIASGVTVDNRVFEEYVVELQGWVGSAMEDLGTFLMFNTVVKTDDGTKYSDGGFPITQKRCFELLSMGRQVQVRGHYEGYALVATSVQITPWFGYLPPPPPPPPPPPVW